MFGDFLSSVIKVVTLPVDVASAAVDVVFHEGDGSKLSRMLNDNPLTSIEEIRDAVADSAKEIDE